MAAVVNGRFSFGEFEIDADRRLLLRAGETVSIKAKTFDLLLALVEKRGEILTKDELLDKVWENQFVEENNLTVHVAALRKTLGEKKNENRYIVTVPGKGYRFVAQVGTPVDEVIVERHSLSRIVVEEEIDQPDYDFERYRSPLLRAGSPIKKSLFLVVALLVTTILAAGLYYRTGDGPDTSANLLSFHTRPFTTGGGGIPERVAISPDGKTIAFVQRRKGQYSLHLGELEANNSVEIIPPADRLYRYLAFSPDGKNIFFTARDLNHMEPALMRVSILGGAIQDLVPDVHSAFSFSPDGRSVAYLRNDPGSNKTALVTAEAATGKGEQVHVVREAVEDAIGAGVSWSPDGKMIAFAGRVDGGYRLLTLNVTDGTLREFGEVVPNRIVNIAWLPDASGLMVIRNVLPQPNDGQIWFVTYPAGEARLMTDDTVMYSFGSLSVSSDNRFAVLQSRSDPQIGVTKEGDLRSFESVLDGTRSRGEGMNGVYYAPDGKILFTAVANDSRTIWEMNADGSDQRQLTAPQRDSADEQIGVTADNRYIVFQSNRSGSLEVWRANRDGSHAAQLTSGGGNSQPDISPDGQWIVYACLRDERYGLRRIPVDGGEPTVLTTEQSTWPSVSPDGRYIAYSHGRISRYPNREMRIIPSEGGRAVRAFEVPLSAVLYNRLRWAPDGSGVIYKDHTQGLWRQLLTAESPEEIEASGDLRIYHFAYTTDGSLVFSGGSQMREIVILEGSN